MLHVINIIFHFHFNTIAFIVFTTFELLVSIFFAKSLKVLFKFMILKWINT